MIANKVGQIIDEIGKGGMATVYRGYQPNMERYVAVKVISESVLGQASYWQGKVAAIGETIEEAVALEEAIESGKTPDPMGILDELAEKGI